MYNRTIQIRLTEDEKAMIVNKMQADGYRNLSSWTRKQLLEAKSENYLKLKLNTSQNVHCHTCNACDFIVDDVLRKVSQDP